MAGRSADLTAAARVAPFVASHARSISGQDVGRGTFSHRHVMLVDQNTESITVPLNNLPHAKVATGGLVGKTSFRR